MNKLIPPVLRATEESYAMYGDDIPFGLQLVESRQYAAEKGMRRFGTISSARGHPDRRDRP
ncbi:hypothetical protein X011_11935 [Mycobacterium tuberculosis variant microti OV254]|nr:hypothetical protein X011_11935 [Mycobacterium tuberculosis variant microti OV254]BBX40587.1 hypothetical protein MSIM_20380 [Mycobacterium simiae]